jgi:hypothetical protein
LTDLEDRNDRTWEEEVEFRRLKFMTDFVEQSPPRANLRRWPHAAEPSTVGEPSVERV